MTFNKEQVLKNWCHVCLCTKIIGAQLNRYTPLNQTCVPAGSNLPSERSPSDLAGPGTVFYRPTTKVNLGDMFTCCLPIASRQLKQKEIGWEKI